VLIIGGSFCGLLCARDLTHGFLVTIVDAKEFFEYTPGVLRAYAKPKHLDALTFTLQPVIETKMQAKFVWGEVLQLHGETTQDSDGWKGGQKYTAVIKPMFTNATEVLDFDYCIIAAGCNFNGWHRWGESLWFPTVHEKAIKADSNSWPQFDERFLEGRRRHILDEWGKVKKLCDEKKTIFVVGAGFIGVEWITEIEHFFPGGQLSICDFLPNCLGPLPKKAADYCKNYMDAHGIKQHYGVSYPIPGKATAEETKKFYIERGFPAEGPDKEYICTGVKASNYFMPQETLSLKGPGGGGWILMDMKLGVKTKEGKPWGADENGLPRIFAVGDCNYSCVEAEGKPPPQWPIPPMPKISYPGEEEAVIACCNLEKVEKLAFHQKTVDCCGAPLALHDMHWPWGAGMFATSLGPDDACFVAGANWNKNSGWMATWGSIASVQKEIIEASITDEAQYGLIGRLIWHFVHHTPVHLFGGGPVWGYTW
jgi:hypothetical protein